MMSSATSSQKRSQPLTDMPNEVDRTKALESLIKTAMETAGGKPCEIEAYYEVVAFESYQDTDPENMKKDELCPRVRITLR